MSLIYDIHMQLYRPQPLFIRRIMSLMSLVSYLTADVYCLQEVDHYDDFLLPLMEARGYSGECLRR